MKNKIGNALKHIGTILLGLSTLVFVFALIVCVTEHDSGAFMAAVASLSGIISGIMFLGFSEVVRLLQEIANSHDQENNKSI